MGLSEFEKSLYRAEGQASGTLVFLVRTMRQPFAVRFMKSKSEMNHMILLFMLELESVSRHWSLELKNKFLSNRSLIAIAQSSNFVRQY